MGKLAAHRANARALIREEIGPLEDYHWALWRLMVQVERMKDAGERLSPEALEELEKVHAAGSKIVTHCSVVFGTAKGLAEGDYDDEGKN